MKKWKRKKPCWTFYAVFLLFDCYYPPFLLPSSTPHPELVTPALSPPGSSPVSWLMIIPMGSHLKCHWSDNNSFAHNFTRPSVPWQAFMGYIFVGPETHCPAILGEHAKAFRPKKKKRKLEEIQWVKYLAWHLRSSAEISVFLRRHITHLEGEERQLLKREKRKRANEWAGAGAGCISIYCSVNNYVQIFLLSCRYLPHEVQTQLSTAGEMFFSSRRQQNDTSWQPDDHLPLRLRAIGRTPIFQTKSTTNWSSMNPMCLVVDGQRPHVSLEKLFVCLFVFCSPLHNSTHLFLLQVILILTKLFDFNLGAVTESSLWR